jgi:leucyl-tRNA synthetase
MKRYNPKEIEPKWQEHWEKNQLYQISDDTNLPKRYILEYFPYPSGSAMHVGHVRNYTIGDVVARFYRMKGMAVLHPMGWDAFGLPAENYAIMTGISPRQAIDENTRHFKQQLMQMGFSYDWSREIDSTDPAYYRWTQWFFLLLFKHGLAYQKESLQWWCPIDKTVLANEQVENGKCWRCGSDVEKRALKQWFFKITAYADRLLDDLNNLDWPEAIKTMQRNWIGRSNGAEIIFNVENSDHKIQVYTTRPDTLWGATFIVLAPEHPLIEIITTAEKRGEVNSYIKHSLARSEIERQETKRQKTGVFSGVYAINPINQQKIPIWIADYVLMNYGTGAIMAVPAHDQRDYDFAITFKLPIIKVIEPMAVNNVTNLDSQTNKKDTEGNYYEGEGKLINSGDYSGLDSSDGRKQILNDLVTANMAKETVNYKMRDWLISRQRYWGAPIPIIYCSKDGVVPVPDKDLPVLLPDITDFQPRDDGQSPLANSSTFVNTICPKCGEPAKRETDTMDGFACSSWYFLRFADPHNDQEPFAKSKVDYWLPVDDYIGGAEHAVMHLLYARFWTKVMFDEGLINFQEPFTKLHNQGMILAPDGSRMSKSKNNTIEPDSLISQGYGADSIRLMELFIGPWNQVAAWSTEGLGGTYHFLQRVWTLCQEFLSAAEINNEPNDTDETFNTGIQYPMHRTIKLLTEDLQKFGFNTAIASLMELVNNLYKLKVTDKFCHLQQWRTAIEQLLKLLAPFAPFISEELWHDLGHNDSIHQTSWPEWNESLLSETSTTIVVQINGKLRAEMKMPLPLNQEDVTKAASVNEKIVPFFNGKTIVKTIYVPDKIINFVLKD